MPVIESHKLRHCTMGILGARFVSVSHEVIKVHDLRLTPHCILTLAQWHFDHWGPLTGAESLNSYVKVLTSATTSERLPRVLIAEKDERLLGSVNLVASDCQIYPDLTPWLAQLFVVPNERTHGVGRALVQAAEREARALGFSTLYLFTSGTLPGYYQRQGWLQSGRFDYLGKERTLMQRDLSAEICSGPTMDCRKD